MVWLTSIPVRLVNAARTKGSFRPDQPITRAGAIARVSRMLDRTPDGDPLLADMIRIPIKSSTRKPRRRAPPGLPCFMIIIRIFCRLL